MHDTLAARVEKLCEKQGRPASAYGCRERLLPSLRAHASGIAAARCDMKTAETGLTRCTREPAAELDRVQVAILS